jgi:hypothetical protein
MQHWGCYHPLRDVAPPPYAYGLASTAVATYGLKGQKPSFRPDAIPPKLLFFAGESHDMQQVSSVCTEVFDCCTYRKSARLQVQLVILHIDSSTIE